MTPRKAEPVDLPEGATTSQAFLAVTAECSAHWRANTEGVIRGREVESLHQLRVGVRRFRSALALFARPLDEPQVRWLHDEIRECALPFGVARDLDVFLLGPQASSLHPEIRDRLRSQREDAYDVTSAVLRSSRWNDAWKLVDRFRAAAPWGMPDDAPATRTARDILERRWRLVVKRGAKLRDQTPTERHRVRIQAKKLRYGAQFFAGLHPDGVGTAPLVFADGVGELQDALGLLNDRYTNAHILASIGLPAPPTDEQVLLEQAVAAHARVLTLEPFWRSDDRTL